MALPHNSEPDDQEIIKLQHELSRVLADMVDPMAAMDKALALVASSPGVGCVWTWFRTADEPVFRLQAAAGLDEGLIAALDVLPADSPLAGRLAAREECWGEPVALWGPAGAAFLADGLVEAAVLPIVSGGEVVGGLGAAHTVEGCDDGRCLWVLRTLAAAVGNLVTHTRLETRQRSHARNLEAVLDAYSDGVFVIDAAGTILHHSEPAGRSAAAQDSGFCGRRLDEILELDPADLLRRATGSSAPILTALSGNDGRSTPVEVTTGHILWDGEPAAVVICRDLSARQTLAAAHERMVTAINQLVETVVITDADGRIEYVNPAFTRMTGYTEAEALGENPRLLKSGVHPPEFYTEMWNRLVRGGIWTGRVVNRRKDGTLFTEQTTINPLVDTEGAITHYVAVKHDVSKEIELEERIRDSQKMEALGTLAGGIAHDFNNILYALLGYADLALDDVPADHPAHGPLQEISRAGNRAAGIVARMLRFGRRGDGDRECVSLSEVLDDCLALVSASLPATVRIETEVAPDLGPVLADGDQLQQVVMNLCSNAERAMHGRGGELRLALDEVRLAPEDALRLGPITPGPYARLRVRDTGCGIEPAMLTRIFEPYFTTREAFEGSGLGLAMVHGIVTDHGGAVTVESKPGQGSEFTVLLPVRPEEVWPAPAPSQDQEQSLEDGRRRILVVDDEEMVVTVLDKGLTRLGFDVTAHQDGVEALEAFRAAPNTFDLVLTDQTMPNITGFELAAKLSAIRPGLPIVLATGHGSAVSEDLMEETGIARVLAKPLRIQELAAILDELLAHDAICP